MARKFEKFPAKAVIITTTMTASLALNTLFLDEGVQKPVEDVSNKVFYYKHMLVMFAYIATISEEWYKAHKNHKSIYIENYDKFNFSEAT